MRALPSKILRTRSTVEKKGVIILCASLKWKWPVERKNENGNSRYMVQAQNWRSMLVGFQKCNYRYMASGKWSP